MGSSKVPESNTPKVEKAPKVTLRDIAAQLHAERMERERFMVEYLLTSE